MHDLITRLEKATGADRELEALIYCAAHGLQFDHYERWSEHGRLYYFKESVGRIALESEGFPRYTSSIDAALTLVQPEGSAWAVSYSPDLDPEGYPKPFRATVMPPLECRLRDATAWSYSATIALCIAALKARDAR